jgi:(2R)-ethylmalonyl-CoA mutase
VLVPAVLRALQDEGIDTGRVPVIVGGIIPESDVERLRAAGVGKVITPGGPDLTHAVAEIASLI